METIAMSPERGRCASANCRFRSRILTRARFVGESASWEIVLRVIGIVSLFQFAEKLLRVGAGAAIINDVSALSFDEQSVATARRLGVPVILMHAQGDPKTMQENPSYDDVALDVSN